MKTNIKDIFLAVAIGGFITVTTTSCKKDDPAPAPDNTITGKVVADANFSTLEAAVTKAGLGSTLSGTGPFTVFAPDNAAFNASAITSLEPLSADFLKKVLLYHTVAAKALAADLPTAVNTKYTTAAAPGVPADSIFVTKNSGGVYINGVKVKSADVSASNGVIHVIDRVLLPPTGELVATVVAANGGDEGLDSLERAVVRVETEVGGLVNLLNSNIVTVFAPTNKAFRSLLTALGVSNINQIPIATLGAVLQHHVLVGRGFSNSLSNGTLTMFDTKNTTIAISSAGATIKGSGTVLPSPTAKIIATDIMCTKAVVHKIDAVIIP